MTDKFDKRTNCIEQHYKCIACCIIVYRVQRHRVHNKFIAKVGLPVAVSKKQPWDIHDNNIKKITSDSNRYIDTLISNEHVFCKLLKICTHRYKHVSRYRKFTRFLHRFEFDLRRLQINWLVEIDWVMSFRKRLHRFKILCYSLFTSARWRKRHCCLRQCLGTEQATNHCLTVS